MSLRCHEKVQHQPADDVWFCYYSRRPHSTENQSQLSRSPMSLISIAGCQLRDSVQLSIKAHLKWAPYRERVSSAQDLRRALERVYQFRNDLAILQMRREIQIILSEWDLSVLRERFCLSTKVSKENEIISVQSCFKVFLFTQLAFLYFRLRYGTF